MSVAVSVAGLAPYRGLTSYREQDADFFFGREREREMIISSLQARRLTLLYGESGVGKSSLLSAGVAASLRSLAREDWARIGSAEFIPVTYGEWRDDPVTGLCVAIRAAAQEFTVAREQLPMPATGVAEVIEDVAQATDAYLLVILDQFEDYFLYRSDEVNPGTFATEFPRAVNQDGLPASFLISIREDALAKLDCFKRAVPKLFDTFLRIGHLDEAAARAAIEKPIARYNKIAATGATVSIEHALVDEVIEQVRAGRVISGGGGLGRVSTNRDVERRPSDPAPGQPTAPGNGSASPVERGEVEAPYLQLVMTRLWDAEVPLGSRRLRLATLQDLGGAENIVSTHVASALGGLSPRQRDTAAGIFQYLVTPSGAKIVHSISDLAAMSGYPKAQVEEVIQDLTKSEARIIRPVPPPPGREGPPRAEIFHDKLAEAILTWRAKYIADRLEADRQRAEADARVQRAKARRLRRVVALLFVVLSLLVVALIVALVYAEDQRSRALANQRVADSRELASEAERNLATDAQLTALLALQALHVEPTAQAASALRDALGRLKPPYVLRTHAALRDATFSPDGRTIVTAGEDGAVRLWDARDGLELRTLHSGRFPVESVDFSPNGREIAAASADGTARIWDAESGRELARSANRGPLYSVGFSPSGQLIVTAGADGARILVLATHQEVGLAVAPRGPTFDAAFSPSSREIVTASGDNNARIFDVVTGRLIGVLAGHTAAVLSAAFSPDGRSIVTASADGTARIWDTSTRKPIAILTLAGQSGFIRSASFSPDGTKIVTASSDGVTRIWDAATGRLVTSLIGSGHLESAAFNPDASRIVATSSDGTARVWSTNLQASLASLEQLAHSLVRRSLTPQERLTYLVGIAS